MGKFNLLRQKFILSRFRCDRFVLLTLVSLLFGLSIGSFKPFPLFAQDVALRSVPGQNPWQYASFPVENFQTYTSGFGYRVSPVTGKQQFHAGLDIAAPLGSYVRSWWSGRVVELSDNTGCGTMIKIQSGLWTHIYCHLMGKVESSPQGTYLIDREGGIIIWLGQEIPVSARIARVGMTGNTTGPHLHWGLMYANQYLDPALVLQEMYKDRAAR
ncbi:M23 family metallopeptidase [Gloeothece verrucosa]|uniref:Peptidase M23 n=1 Tax=Gloeothece verrucosa (strain PCC 7822) TaxID=497965 RepID=E0UK05_GLOV7|nr:M23 family metallopeptidase [Gloeothece verrucosa]ADN14641.1 Peptidase M23 [Gloeothece verrucosa PCC 7822]